MSLMQDLFTPHSLSPDIYQPGTQPVKPLLPTAFEKMYGSHMPSPQKTLTGKISGRLPPIKKTTGAIPIPTPTRPGTPLHANVVSPPLSPPLPPIKEESGSVDELVQKKQLEIKALKKQLSALGKKNGSLSRKCRKIQEASEQNEKQHAAIVKTYDLLLSQVLDDIKNGESREDIVAHIVHFRKEHPLKI